MPDAVTVVRLPFAAILLMILPVWVACKPAAPASATTSGHAHERIISISPNATEMIGAMEHAGQLVGVSTFCLWPPVVKTLPRIGGLFDANPELILKLRPDLIIIRGVNRSVEQVCAASGIQLYRDRTERFSDIYTTMDELGELLGDPANARRVREEMQARLKTLAAAIAGRHRPRVLMTLARRTDSLGEIMTGTRMTFIQELIEYAGGENVFADLSLDYPRVSPEAVVAAHPDVILEAMPETPDSAALRSMILEQWARLGPIPAVQRGRIHILHDENCLIPSPRIVDVIERIASLLHPEVDLARR